MSKTPGPRNNPDPRKSKPDPAERMALLTDAYLHGELSPEGLAELESLIQSDPTAAARFIAVTEQSSMMREVFTNVTDQLEVVEDKETDDFLSILAELDASEGEPPAPIDFTAEHARREMEAKEESRRARQRTEKQQAVIKPSRPFVISKMAGALAFAAMLGLVAWLGSPVAKQPAAPLPQAQTDRDQPDFAARVTATAGARWEGPEAPTLGSRLQPCDLNLTHGQATLVFENGARVALQAPARFTILDKTSGHLHRGELSARVPESGHGFEVWFPGGVVTDLGTAFRVVVGDDPEQPARVEVDQGEVEIALIANGARGRTIRLTQDQFADIQADGSGIAAYAIQEQRVDLVVPTTGLGIDLGQVDPSWTIRRGEQGRSQPAYATDTTSSPWLAGGRDGSQWVSPDPTTQDFPPGRVFFETRLVIPEGVDPATVELDLRFIVDDQLMTIRVNGEQVAGPFALPFPNRARDAAEQYRTWSQAQVSRGFRHGENRIVFEVQTHGGRVGLRAELTCTGISRYEPLAEAGRRQDR